MQDEQPTAAFHEEPKYNDSYWWIEFLLANTSCYLSNHVFRCMQHHQHQRDHLTVQMPDYRLNSFSRHSFWLHAGTPSENMRGFQIYLWCSIPKNTRNHKTCLQWQQIKHHGGEAQELTEKMAKSLATPISNSWKPLYWGQNEGKIRWISWYATVMLDNVHSQQKLPLQEDQNIYIPLSNAPLVLMRKSLVPLEDMSVTSNKSHQPSQLKQTLHWFNLTEPFFFKGKWLGVSIALGSLKLA